MPTRDELTAAIEDLHTAYMDWYADTETQRHPVVNASIEAAVENLSKVVYVPAEQYPQANIALEDFDHELPEIAMAAAQAVDLFRSWEDEYRAGVADADGTVELWAGIRAAQATSQRPTRLKTLTSPLNERKHGVGDRQIAKMYEWKLPDGTPDVAEAQRVLSQLERGDLEWDDSFTAPSEMLQVRRIRNAWRSWLAGLDDRLAEIHSIPGDEYDPDALDDLLWESDGSETPIAAKQIIKMLKPAVITEDEIKARATELGIQLRDMPNLTATSRRKSLTEQIADAERELEEKNAREEAADTAEGHEEIEDLNMRLLVLADAGNGPSAIMDIVRLDYPDLTAKSISARVIKMRKKMEKADT